MTQNTASQRRRSFSSLLLGLSNISETVLPLVRGMVLARLLQPDQFGLAITVTIVASIAELVSELGVNQMALRFGIGEHLSTLHSLAAIRGIILGCIIALSGPLFAYVFNTPETTWIYSIAGLASGIRGFTHLETKARMRRYEYAPEAVTILSAQLIWTLASVGVAFILPDYRAMVIGLVASAAGSVLISHIMSSDPFRLQWDREVVSGAVSYGRPLIFNGIALSIAGLGDRFLIGWRVGLGALAQYTALASAAFLPRSAVTKFMVSLFTPQFVNASTPDDQRRLADIWILTLATMGGVFGLVFIGCGQELVAIAFGKKYVIAQGLINIVAVLACIRYMATAPLAPSMALGRTKLVLANTASAASGLVLGAALLLRFPYLDVLVSAMIIGEGVSLLWILYRLQRFVSFTPIVLWTATIIPNVLTVGITVALLYRPDLPIESRVALCTLALVILLSAAVGLLRVSGSRLSDVMLRLFPRHQPAAASSG